MDRQDAKRDPLEAYRDAVAKYVHAVCFDRNLDPDSKVDTEATCRIERFLPQMVQLAKAAGPNNMPGFEAAVEQTICRQCGNLDALGVCRVREQAECCLYRYLPLVYEAIHSVKADPA